jgi:hypothetical protein
VSDWEELQLEQVAHAWETQAQHAESAGATHAGLWRRVADKARAAVIAYIEMSEELD